MGGNATVGCAFEVQSDHLQKIPSEMEEELPYKLLSLSHGLQCFHQLSLPLLTMLSINTLLYDFKGFRAKMGTEWTGQWIPLGLLLLLGHLRGKKVVYHFATAKCKIDDVFCKIQ